MASYRQSFVQKKLCCKERERKMTLDYSSENDVQSSDNSKTGDRENKSKL